MSGRRILLIDHIPADRERVAQRLLWEIPGLAVVEAADVDGFSRALEAGGFDLVITEAALPWIDGPGVLRAVKARWPDCPVLVVSSARDEDAAAAAIRAGAEEYLPKSASHLAALGPAVAAALRRSQEPRPGALHPPPGMRGGEQAAPTEATRFPDQDPDPLLSIDGEGQVSYANAASAALLHEWGSGVGRQAPPLWRSLTAEVLERQARRVVEASYGERIYAFTLLPSPTTGEVLVFATDVTPRKQLEDALQESQRALAATRQAGDEWWRASDASTDPMALLDAEGRILRVNRALAGLLQRPPDSLAGLRASTTFNGAEASPDSALTRCLRDREPATEEWTPPGSTRSFLRTYAPVLGPQGALAGVILTAKDLTAEKRRERQLLHAEKMSGLHRLASGLAHELNNPLTALIGHAQFLQLAQADEKVRQRADIIVHEAERMAKIIRRLVAFARPRRGDRRPLPINTVVEEAVAACRARLEDRQIQPTLRMASGVAPVLGDREQLREVFLNLLQNAEEAIASTGAPGEIRITSAPSSAGWVRVTVEDTGPGIPPAILGKVFDPFFTTRGTGEGAGLGLTLCALILKEHEGRIQAANRPEGGARVEVELPARVSGRAPNAGGAPDPPGEAKGGRRVLVVDDQESVAQFVAGALEMDGYQVEVALGGAAAAALLAARDYDLVLMDFNMPGMRGDRLYREVRAMKDPGPRMAIMTAGALDPDAAAFLADTRLPLLEKPFTIEAIRSFVRSLSPEAAPGGGEAASGPPLPSD